MWNPIEARQSQWQNIDFDSLISGKVPAVILKNFYDNGYCSSIVKKITEQHSKISQTGNLEHLGPFLMSYTTKKDEYFNQVEKFQNSLKMIFSGHDIPSERICKTLQKIFPTAEIALAKDSERNFSPFVIRIHKKGHSIPIHKDHVGYEGKEYSVSKMKHQLSCVLHLQESEIGGELIIYNKNWKKNDERFRNIDFGYSKDVVLDEASCRLSKVESGDLVIINPIHYHEVTTIKGNVPRITLGMFLGFSESKNKIVSWA